MDYLNGDECFSEFLLNMLTFRISPVVPVHDMTRKKQQIPPGKHTKSYGKSPF